MDDIDIIFYLLSRYIENYDKIKNKTKVVEFQKYFDSINLFYNKMELEKIFLKSINRLYKALQENKDKDFIKIFDDYDFPASFFNIKKCDKDIIEILFAIANKAYLLEFYRISEIIVGKIIKDTSLMNFSTMIFKHSGILSTKFIPLFNQILEEEFKSQVNKMSKKEKEKFWLSTSKYVKIDVYSDIYPIDPTSQPFEELIPPQYKNRKFYTIDWWRMLAGEKTSLAKKANYDKLKLVKDAKLCHYYRFTKNYKKCEEILSAYEKR